ncbi:MAG: hypothetical protein QOI07_355, partial [Verrucomicrobiota bacterium]
SPPTPNAATERRDYSAKGPGAPPLQIVILSAAKDL